MKRRRIWTAVLIFPLLLMQNVSAFARTKYHGEGIINRVEPILGIVNISHGPVPAVGWDTMTHDVHVKPRELTQGLVPGMRVRFQVTVIDPLTYVITAIKPVN